MSSRPSLLSVKSLIGDISSSYKTLEHFTSARTVGISGGYWVCEIWHQMQLTSNEHLLCGSALHRGQVTNPEDHGEQNTDFSPAFLYRKRDGYNTVCSLASVCFMLRFKCESNFWRIVSPFFQPGMNAFLKTCKYKAVQVTR